MIYNTKEILQEAKKNKYAVGAFNVINMETTQAVLEAAKEMRSPVIIQLTEKTIDYAGGKNIFSLIKNLANFYYPEIPVAIHLDHGKNFEIIKKAIALGFPSVMYDASRKSFQDNLQETKEIAQYCHKKNVSIQAELGNVPNYRELDMQNINWDDYMTKPEEAVQFVQETKIDTLAVGIGNAHSFTQERPEPDYNRLEKISQLVETPLVLHGASDWEGERVKKVIDKGISCFNIDTALRVAFTDSLVSTLTKNLEKISYDLRRTLGEARKAVKEEVKHKIKLFGSDNKI